ncbi:uncharacterized protein E0L32_007899 [Thyridium curvatum]|uniref:Uncharacterized protein n=1 Tax=Thyridium curvatum TaxID=1093900 RepID=A0A507B4F0_9PEZI|nr:uncharacterized protein E0L32_007899 [Thyridium curvatum]TPX11480.1 hypothetical protein E0L32_007899 [Thyridium curvatum]
MLKLRSKVIKLSISLNSIGAEVGRLLDKNEPEELAREEQDHDESTANSGPSQGSNSPEAFAETSPKESAIEGHTEQANSRLEGPDHGSPVHRHSPLSRPSLQPTVTSAPERNDIALQSQLSDFTTGCNGRQGPGLEDVLDPDHEYQGHFDWLDEPADLPELSPMNLGSSSGPLRPVAYHQQAELASEFPPQNSATDFNAHNLYSASTACSLPFVASSQGMELYNFNEERPESPRAIQGEEATMYDWERQTSVAISMVPPQVGISIPPGLHPVSSSETPGGSFLMKSRLSEHIEVMEAYIRLRLTTAPEKISRRRLHRLCASIMSLTAHNAWPPIVPLWFRTQAPEIIMPVLTWRLYPSPETYKGMLPDWRPTELQITVPHSALIDLVPYSALRDRVLTYYNGGVALDRLFCDLLNSYAIEVNDVSKVLPLEPPGKAYFGVSNVFKAIYMPRPEVAAVADVPMSTDLLNTGSSSSDTSIQEVFDEVAAGHDWQEIAATGNLTLQRRERRQSLLTDNTLATSLTEILATPELALRLSHSIRLYAAKSWKLDRSFFEAWPELKFDGHETLVAQGRSYRISTETDAPVALTETTIKMYHDTLQAVV